MGNSISLQPYQVSHLQNQHLWQLQAQKQYCKIYRNLQTGSLCQQYLLQLPAGKIKQDIEIYEDRFLTPHKNIVKVYYLNYQQSPGMCSINERFRVRTQLIPHRINELNLLPSPEALFVLMETLSGFAEIAYRYAFVRVDPEMIGLSSDGKIKVWLNPNYSKCFPEDHAVFRNQDNEGLLVNEMIRQIYQIVENQSKGPIANDSVRNRILRANSFENALSIIKQFINLDQLTMTSVNLPGNSMKQTQLDLTKYKPTSAAAPQLTSIPQPQSVANPSVSVSAPIPHFIHQNDSHQESMLIKNITKRPSFSQREQLRNYKQNPQFEFAAIKPQTQRRVIEPSFHSHSTAHLQRQKGTNNEYPAEFVQSQLIRDPIPVPKIRNIDNNQRILDNQPQVRTSRLIPIRRSLERQYSLGKSHQQLHNSQPNFAPIIPSYSNSPQVQTYSQNKFKFRQHSSPIPVFKQRFISTNSTSFPVQSIPQPQTHNPLNQTARFTLIQPTTNTSRPLIQRLPNTNHYASENNFTINVLPPSKESRLGDTRNLRHDIGNEYVNSSFVPNVVGGGHMSPSEVVNSTPASLFSNIEYGHGVVRNRQPR